MKKMLKIFHRMFHRWVVYSENGIYALKYCRECGKRKVKELPHCGYQPYPSDWLSSSIVPNPPTQKY